MMKQRMTCICGGKKEFVDSGGISEVRQCSTCHECSLVVNGHTLRGDVRLRNYVHRMQDRCLHRDMANELVAALISDVWPSSATTMDFGICSSEHLGTLQALAQAGVTAFELDKVMGDGGAITALARMLPHCPYGDVIFRTPYDEMVFSSVESD